MRREDDSLGGSSVFRHAITAVVVVAAVYVVVSGSRPPPALGEASGPAPGLSPQSVIRIQLAALRQNTSRDDGIAVAFRFASPENRDRTGPLDRFATMIRSASYKPLLNHLSVQYGATLMLGDRSYKPVIVTDRRGVNSGYLWVLSRDTDRSCVRCWMTDSVLLIGRLERLRFA